MSKSRITNYKDFNPKNHKIYHKALISDSIIIILIDSLIFSLSLILGNYALYFINGIEFQIINGWLIVPAWIIFSFYQNYCLAGALELADDKKFKKLFFYVCLYFDRIPFI